MVILAMLSAYSWRVVIQWVMFLGVYGLSFVLEMPGQNARLCNR
jgi:hypothetical protein